MPRPSLFPPRMALALALLADLPLIADGRPAGLLEERAGRGGQPRRQGLVEALNEAHPELVQALHAEYATAGARLLRTNTAQAQSTRLAGHGLAERSEALNNSASALARGAFSSAAIDPEGRADEGRADEGRADEGRASRGLVMGTLEPPPEAGLVHEPAWRRAYGEQIIYLSDTAVDFFLLQHCARLDDALALTEAVKRASDAPVLAGLLLAANGRNSACRTADGHAAAQAAAALAAAGADALGLSCGPGPAALSACLEALQATGLPVAVLAGLHDGHGTPPYPGAPMLEPAAFADWLAPLANQGVAILGGCCGCTPAHIRALAEAVKGNRR